MTELNWKANEFTPRRATDAVTIPVGLPDDPFVQVRVSTWTKTGLNRN